MPSLLELLLFLAALGCAVHSLMANRTPQGTVAWLLALFALPVLAVPLYLTFGRRHYGAYAHKLREIEAAAGEPPPDGALALPTNSQHPARNLDVIEALAGAGFKTGNRIELLHGGQSTFERMMEAIDAAEETLLVQFYIFRDDALGRLFRDKVLAAAARGVRCYVLYDGIGSSRTPDSYFSAFGEGGVRTASFGSLSRLFFGTEPNFRNHRKAIVCDGRIAFMGGHNIGDEYAGRHPKFGFWRDASLRVEGPVAREIERIFAQDWAFATGEHLAATLHPENGAEPEGDLPAAYLATGPADPMETCSLFFLTAIGTAKRRLWITSPYFVPDSAVMSALRLAAARGVDVRVLVPDKPDHLLVWLAGFDFLEQAERAGVEAYRYTRGFLHEKIMLIDDDIACVGTANLDNRSLRLNFEATMIVPDRRFAAEVESALEQDFRDSREHGERDYQQKSLFFKVAVRAARLLSPVL